MVKESLLFPAFFFFSCFSLWFRKFRRRSIQEKRFGFFDFDSKEEAGKEKYPTQKNSGKIGADRDKATS